MEDNQVFSHEADHIEPKHNADSNLKCDGDVAVSKRIKIEEQEMTVFVDRLVCSIICSYLDFKHTTYFLSTCKSFHNMKNVIYEAKLKNVCECYLRGWGHSKERDQVILRNAWMFERTEFLIKNSEFTLSTNSSPLRLPGYALLNKLTPHLEVLGYNKYDAQRSTFLSEIVANHFKVTVIKFKYCECGTWTTFQIEERETSNFCSYVTFGSESVCEFSQQNLECVLFQV
jgi:hypothetical protein